MLSLLNDMHDPLGRIMTLYRRNVQQYCSSVHDIKRNQCQRDFSVLNQGQVGPMPYTALQSIAEHFNSPSLRNY